MSFFRGLTLPAWPYRHANRSRTGTVVAALLLAILWIVLFRSLEPLSHWLTTRVVSLSGMPPGGRAASAFQFFVFEVPKVMMLLTLVVFGVGIVRSFFTPERTRRMLAGRRETAGNVMAALLGVVTPFCSCSAVPLFLGFVTTGVPLGVTFSFLVSAPMVNEVALVLLWGLFGWQVALLYLATGLSIAIGSGWVIGRLRLERWVQPWVYDTRASRAASPSPPASPSPLAPPLPLHEADAPSLTWGERAQLGRDAVRDITGRVWPFVVVGIAVGALIHGYVPEDFMASIMGPGAWWSVPLAVLLGVPMYSNAAGIIPVVEALLGKGAALGTVLAFMMSVIALSLPEMIILRRVLQVRLVLVFAGVVALGITIVGWLFNLII